MDRLDWGIGLLLFAVFASGYVTGWYAGQNYARAMRAFEIERQEVLYGEEAYDPRPFARDLEAH